MQGIDEDREVRALYDRCDITEYWLNTTYYPPTDSISGLMHTVLENQMEIMRYLADMEPIVVRRKKAKGENP